MMDNEQVELEQIKTYRSQNKKLSFDEIKQALTTTHTLSTRMICEYLKTYRPWVTKYILPKLDKIYIPTGRGNSKSSADWVWWLRKFNNIDIKESSWYRRNDFENLLKDSLISCTRQTISVSLTALIDEKERPCFLNDYIPLKESLEEARKTKKWETINKIEKELSKLYSKYLGNGFIQSSEIYWNGSKNIPVINAAFSKRSATEQFPYDMKVDYTSLSAVHDLKGYGGIDEEIYRSLFVNGAIRLEYHFTAENGDHGEKIFYCFDRSDEKYRLNDPSPTWTLPYSFWLKVKKI